jgi:hypothetical protein
MASAEATKSVEAHFPKAPIDIKINDLGQEPTPLRIIKFQKYIQQCAINIPIKGETLGLLGAVISPTDYQTVSNNRLWTAPTTPGTAPTMPPATTTAQTATRSTTDTAAATAGETNRILTFQQEMRNHEKEVNTWTIHQAALTALRNLIINNIDEEYIAEHCNALTGFRLVTPATLLDHIKDNYGDVEPMQLKENEKTLEAPWDPSTPVATLYKRIEDCKLFAEAGDEPIPDKKVLRAALLAIESTGLYNLACDTWMEKPTATKTWANFKLFFSKESKKVKHHTTGSLGMQDATANALLELNDAFTTQQQQIQELANNRQPLAELPIQEQINNIMPPTEHANELQILKEQVQSLLAAVSIKNKSTGNSYEDSDEENQPPARQNRKPTKEYDIRAQGYDKAGFALTYCHTHGISRNLNHGSCNCKYPAKGHKKAATLSNKLGGSTKVCQKSTRDT